VILWVRVSVLGAYFPIQKVITLVFVGDVKIKITERFWEAKRRQMKQNRIHHS
jgi:hypothetical protein